MSSLTLFVFLFLWSYHPFNGLVGLLSFYFLSHMLNATHSWCLVGCAAAEGEMGPKLHWNILMVIVREWESISLHAVSHLLIFGSSFLLRKMRSLGFFYHWVVIFWGISNWVFVFGFFFMIMRWKQCWVCNFMCKGLSFVIIKLVLDQLWVIFRWGFYLCSKFQDVGNYFALGEYDWEIDIWLIFEVELFLCVEKSGGKLSP